MTTAKVALATAAFALVHSVAATARAKDAAARRYRFGRELYRVVYNVQAAATFGVLVWYIAAQPKQTIYRVTGPLAWLMRLGQAGGGVFAAAAARATGIVRLSGLDNLFGVVRGTGTRRPPAAQGPEADDDGTLRISGPFKLVRHPLNLAPLAPFWLTPHMTTRRLAFNLVATAYLVLGSIHEERRLLDAYGERYAGYQRGGTPFFVPALNASRAPSQSPPSDPSPSVPSPTWSGSPRTARG